VSSCEKTHALNRIQKYEAHAEGQRRRGNPEMNRIQFSAFLRLSGKISQVKSLKKYASTAFSRLLKGGGRMAGII